MNKLLKFSLHTIIFSFLVLPIFAFAQPIGLENPIGVDSISGLIRIVVKVIRYIAIPFVVVMIMYAGFLYIWEGAKGNHDGLKISKMQLTWILVGSFIILSAEMIAIVIENTLKSLR